MGRDKALLPHPRGGTWLEASLRLLASLEAPITLLSRHAAHHELARALVQVPSWRLEVLLEPPPWEGPLRALGRLMARHPGERLLLCPVDMPGLNPACLQALVAAAAAAPERIHLAHDGRRLQPLLGVYPALPAREQRLQAVLAGGERGLQRWLAGELWSPVPLPAGPLRNLNRPEELETWAAAPA